MQTDKARIMRFPKRERIQGSGGVPLGRIRKGAPQEVNAKGKTIVGRNLTYFRVDWNDNHPHIDAARASAVWNEIYGPEPSSLSPVVFLRDAIPTVWQEANEQYKRTDGGNPYLLRRCNGESIYMDRSPDGPIIRTESPCQSAVSGGPGCSCVPVGRLFMCLPDFCKAYGVWGEFMFITHSTIDIDSIRSTLDDVMQRNGRLGGLAYSLFRVPELIPSPDGRQATQHMVKLQLAPAAAQLIAGQMALEAAAPVLSLPEPITEIDDAPNAFPKSVTLFPRVKCWLGEKADTYGFKNDTGQYYTSDVSLISAVCPDYLKLADNSVTELPYREIRATVDGDRIISMEGVK